MSDMRRAAKGLVEIREERFTTNYSLEEAEARLLKRLEKLEPDKAVVFKRRWDTDPQPTLVVMFGPPRGVGRTLQVISMVLFLMIGASAYALLQPDAGPGSYLVVLGTGLAILGVPFFILALASGREAEESRIRKAIRVALMDEEEIKPLKDKD